MLFTMTSWIGNEIEIEGVAYGFTMGRLCLCDCCGECECEELKRDDCPCDFVLCTMEDGSVVSVRCDYVVALGAEPIDFDNYDNFDATMGSEAVEFAMYDVEADTFEWELSTATRRGEGQAMAGIYAVEGVVDYFVEECAHVVDHFVGFLPTMMPECTVDATAVFAPWQPTVTTG